MSRPTVLERALHHLLEVDSTTGKFAARVLEVGHWNTIVSDLKKHWGIDVRREWRRQTNQYGQEYNAKVYWLAQDDREKAARALAKLEARRLARDAGGRI